MIVILKHLTRGGLEKSMVKGNFSRILLIIGGFFMFVKIYQCNRYIKKNYEKQRVEKSISCFLKKIDELNIALVTLQHYQKIDAWASLELGMQPLSTSRLMTLTNDDEL